MSHTDSPAPPSHPQSMARVIFKRRLERWFRIWMRESIAPITDASARFQLSGILAILVVIFLAFDASTVASQTLAWAAENALIWAIPVFLVWNAVIALFRTRKEEREEGDWFATSWVYAEPKLVYRQRISNADNGRPFQFTVSEAEPGGAVVFRMEYEGMGNRLTWAVMAPDVQLPSDFPGNMQLRQRNPGPTYLVVPPNKSFRLYTFSQTPAPTLIRVRLISWDTECAGI